MYAFLDSHNAATAKTLRVKPGMYQGLKLRFNIDQAAGQQVTNADLGELVVTYHNNQKTLINFGEISVLDGYKYGVREDVDAGAGLVHTMDFYLPIVHWLDPFSTVWIKSDTDCFVQWNPAATLAAKVDSLTLRLTGHERAGVMTHFLGFNRVDIAMVSGTTRPEEIRPYNTTNLFVEYDTDISLVQLIVDGRTEIQNMAAIELLNQTLLDNRVETYATAGQFFEVDFMASRQWDIAGFIRGLNSRVELTLTGSAADTISAFNAYVDTQVIELASTEVLYRQYIDKVLANKAATGGQAAIQVYSALKNRTFFQEA